MENRKKNEIKSFKDLIVWQLSSEFSKEMAQFVKRFPRKEQYALADDLLRAARSVSAQISEGFRKVSLKEKHRFYEIAVTSNDETENHLNEAKNNNFVNNGVYKSYLNRVIRVRILLSRLMKSIRSLDTARKSHNRREATIPASLMPHNRSNRAEGDNPCPRKIFS